MRALATIVLLLVLAGAALAEPEYGFLDACTAGNCQPTTVTNLHQKAVLVRLTAGTFTVNVQCRIGGTSDWANIPLGEAGTTLGQVNISATTLVRFEHPCHQIRMAVGACAGCTYVAAYRGFRRGE